MFMTAYNLYTNYHFCKYLSEKKRLTILSNFEICLSGHENWTYMERYTLLTCRVSCEREKIECGNRRIPKATTPRTLMSSVWVPVCLMSVFARIPNKSAQISIEILQIIYSNFKICSFPIIFRSKIHWVLSV